MFCGKWDPVSLNLPLEGATTPLLLEDSSMSLEDALKTSLKGRVNWQRVFTLSTSAWRHGRLEQQLGNLLLVFIMVLVPPQATISTSMVDMMDHRDGIPSTGWTLIHWSGPSYPVGP